MNFIPAGAESEDEEENVGALGMPDFIAEQFGHHGWNVNNVVNIFDDLDLHEFDIDDDFYDEDDYEDFYDDLESDDFDFLGSDNEHEEIRRKYVTGIFKTLEDSALVLNRLSFHRETSKETGPRLPRILPGQTETYETLHKLLEEVELLLKVWRNRVNHPFTAHLERKTEETSELEPDSGIGVSSAFRFFIWMGGI